MKSCSLSGWLGGVAIQSSSQSRAVDLSQHGLDPSGNVHWNTGPEELHQMAVELNEAKLTSDSVLLAITLYNKVKFNIFDFLSQSSYRKRMNIDKDIAYCLQKDTMSIVPIGFVNSQSGEIYFKIYNNELCQ